MDLAGPILGIASSLRTCTTNYAKCYTDLQGNLSSLSDCKNELHFHYEELRRRVERAETPQMMRLERVDAWLRKAVVLQEEVVVILQNGHRKLQSKCLFKFLPWNCYSRYSLGKTVIMKLDEMREVLKGGNFDIVAYQLPRAPVDEIPEENTTVGLDPLLEEVWSYLEDSSVGVIGLFGLGGVGKTTLLKKINNEFLNRTHNFDVAIWVVASKEVNMEKIQEGIRKKLEIDDHIWAKQIEEGRAAVILRALKTRRFVLMIDDIWERIDLAKLGIPLFDPHSKVIFTSRSRDVCGHMEAQRRIRVGCLAREEALILFQMKVGEETLNSHPDIPKLAKVVAEECEGLPLALITIGRAMRSRNTPYEWNHAISVLQSYPSEFSGMVDHVFPVLRFSYDSLPGARVKDCFLYCSMFREDYNIRKDELINLWIGEGLLGEYDNIHEAFNHGEFLIGTLKLACLLESDESEEFVRMHDMIRDMALWVANSSERDRNKILVLNVKPTEAHRFGTQLNAERISVWGHQNSIESFTEGVRFCPTLLSLFVKDTMLNSFSNGFFEYLHALKVLNLSGNLCLTMLPESIGELVNLQYLNLSETAITELTLELKKLKKLKSLLLNYTKHLKGIPTGLISSLPCLQVFNMLTVEFSSSQTPLYDEIALLGELDCLSELGDLRITIRSGSGARCIWESTILVSCIKKLSFNYLCDLSELRLPSSSLERMRHLVKLEIMFCKSLKWFDIIKQERWPQYFPCLQEVVIWGCCLSNATWLIYAPRLQKLTVAECPMEMVIKNNSEDVEIGKIEIFSSLRTLHLQGLPWLESICLGALPFPALIEIHIDQCKALLKLPLNASSARGLKQIKGKASWWNQLQWDDTAIKDAFRSKFVEIPDYV